jgi:hypothetical protein
MIDTIANSDRPPSSGTIAIITGTGGYRHTIDSLKKFFDIDEVRINEATIDMSGNALPNRIDIYL